MGRGVGVRKSIVKQLPISKIAQLLLHISPCRDCIKARHCAYKVAKRREVRDEGPAAVRSVVLPFVSIVSAIREENGAAGNA